MPFAKKYFLGGATSIRGWGRYEISPLSGSGFPIGGNSLFAFSSELRAVLAGNLGGVLFFDAGNVWTDGWTIDSTICATPSVRDCDTRRRSGRSASISAIS